MTRIDKSSMAKIACELEHKHHVDGLSEAKVIAASLRRLITHGGDESVSQSDVEEILNRCNDEWCTMKLRSLIER